MTCAVPWNTAIMNGCKCLTETTLGYIASITKCDLILEIRRYPHNFQNGLICSMFSTGTEEWTS